MILYSTGKQTYDPTRNNIGLFKIHTGFGFLKVSQTYRKNCKVEN
jgi:hypothetical protein